MTGGHAGEHSRCSAGCGRAVLGVPRGAVVGLQVNRVPCDARASTASVACLIDISSALDGFRKCF